jgi:hypothetical protein
MPRTSRSVAQRLASQQGKIRKKRGRSPGGSNAPVSPSMAQILDEVVPSEAGSRAAATPTVARPDEAAAAPSPARQNVAPTSRTSPRPAAPARPATRTGAAARAGARPALVRRRYEEYGAEYAYVWADLRRIAIVAGALVVMLIVLSFFIQ